MNSQEKLGRIVALAQVGCDYPDMADRVMFMITDITSGARANSVTAYEQYLGEFHGKFQAVKAFKERTGVNLIISKETVENFFAKHGLKFYQGSGLDIR